MTFIAVTWTVPEACFSELRARDKQQQMPATNDTSANAARPIRIQVYMPLGGCWIAVVSWLLFGCWLVCGWMLVGCWLIVGWLLVGCAHPSFIAGPGNCPLGWSPLAIEKYAVGPLPAV